MKKSLFIITSRFPFPPIGGDRLKTYNLLLILSKYYDIDLISLTDKKIEKNAKEYCKKYCKKYKIFYKSKYQSYFNVIKSIYTKKPLNVQYYYFKDIQDYVNKQLPKCDFAISISTKTSEYLIHSDKLKFLDIVDSRAINYQRSKKHTLSFFWKNLYAFDEKRMFQYEKKCMNKFNSTFFVNNKESEYWSQYGNTNWVPNGVNEILFNYDKQVQKFEKHIAFFGRMDYQPNIDALEWFLQNVFEKLNNDIKLIIIGIDPINKIKEMASNRIVVTGFLDDPYEILNGCFAIIAPMQSGGGIQNKILETMTLGKTIITTSLGAEPIVGAHHNKHLLVYDNANDMAHSINDIYMHKNKYISIGQNAKKLMKENYTWKIYETQLIDLISEKISNI